MLLKLLGGLFNLGILPIVVLFLVMLFAPQLIEPVVGAGGSFGDLLGGLVPVDGAETAGAEAFGEGGLLTLFIGVLTGRLAGFFGSRD